MSNKDLGNIADKKSTDKRYDLITIIKAAESYFTELGNNVNRDITFSKDDLDRIIASIFKNISILDLINIKSYVTGVVDCSIMRTEEEMHKEHKKCFELIWYESYMRMQQHGGKHTQKRIEATYPKEVLQAILEDPFEHGQVLGRLSLFRWLSGFNWDKSTGL